MEKARQLYEASGWWKNEVLSDIVDRWAEQTPERTAIVDGSRRLTYKVFADQSKQLALGLHRLGVGQGDLIALQLPNWTEFALMVVALGRLGAMFTQIGSGFREREVEFILRFSRAKGLVIPYRFGDFDYVAMAEKIVPNLSHFQHTIVVRGDGSHPGIPFEQLLVNEDPDENLWADSHPQGDDVMRMVFTSGTTGDPKAVLHSYNTTLATPRLTAQRLGMGPNMVMMIFLPLGLNWAFLNLMEAFHHGATAVFVEKFEAGRVLQLIEAERVTHFCTAPTALMAMLNYSSFGTFDLGSLRYIISGGASCPVEVIHQVVDYFPGHFLELYGMLETGVHTCTSPEDDPLAVAGSVGTCLEGMEVRVLDDEGNDVPPGVAGEIAARGPSVALGYYQRPDANKAAFTEDDWFLTGDIAVMDEKGLLRIVDRKKEMIIRGGANIYPREVEEILYSHPHIMQAAVVGIPDPYLGEKSVACVVPRPNTRLTLDDVTSFLEGKIAKYKWPERLELFEELPLTPSGKIQKFALRELIVHRGNDEYDEN